MPRCKLSCLGAVGLMWERQQWLISAVCGMTKGDKRSLVKWRLYTQSLAGTTRSSCSVCLNSTMFVFSSSLLLLLTIIITSGNDSRRLERSPELLSQRGSATFPSVWPRRTCLFLTRPTRRACPQDSSCQSETFEPAWDPVSSTHWLAR